MKYDLFIVLFWCVDFMLWVNIVNDIFIEYDGFCILLWNKKFFSCECNWFFLCSIFRFSCDYCDNVFFNSVRKCVGFVGYLEKLVDEKFIFFFFWYVIFWVFFMWFDYLIILCSKRVRCCIEKLEIGGSGVFVREECGCVLC